MELNRLRYFLAVAETEHVTRAAQRLSIAQPALTRALHRLEDELGVKLFVREGRNIRLTPEGAYLRDRCAAPLEELVSIEQAIRAFSETERSTVAICMNSASVLVVDAIAAYSAEHPEVLFAVTQEERPDFADIIVMSQAWSAGVDKLGFVERIGVALPCDTALFITSGGEVREGVHLADLRDAGFIALAGSRGMRPYCDRLCAERGFAPRVLFESDNPSVVRKMIGLGLGVGFWPEYSWGPLDESSVWLPIKDEGFQRLVTSCITARGMEKPAARDFKRYLEGFFAAIWADGASI